MSQAIAEMSIGFVPGFDRLMREHVLVQRNSEYLTAARLVGARGACILLATLGFNLLGDGLRDYFDPTHTR